MKTQTEVCIVGAGPGGSTTALFLNKHGIPCVLLDRAVFPRDKICGESYDGHVVNTLRRLDSNILLDIKDFVLENRKYTLINSKYKRVDISFSPMSTPRLLGRRIDFDNYLFQTAKKSKHIDARENTAVKNLQRIKNKWELTTASGDTITTKILIWAVGAGNPLTPVLKTNKRRSHQDFLFARGYYQDIKKYNDEVVVEIFFVRKPIPLCISLCPVGQNRTNVGIGINKAKALKKGIIVRKLLPEVINSHPELKARFKNAVLEGSIKGAKMQLPSSKTIYSGEGFLLVGDSADSINPVTGYGVGHAMAQGHLASIVIKKSLLAKNTSASFFKQYDHEVRKLLGKEILLSRFFTMGMGFIPLLDRLIGISIVQSTMRQVLSKSDFVEKIMKPFYWKQ